MISTVYNLNTHTFTDIILLFVFFTARATTTVYCLSTVGVMMYGFYRLSHVLTWHATVNDYIINISCDIRTAYRSARRRLRLNPTTISRALTRFDDEKNRKYWQPRWKIHTQTLRLLLRLCYYYLLSIHCSAAVVDNIIWFSADEEPQKYFINSSRFIVHGFV